MATYPQLIAHRLSIPEIREHLGVDSLAYLTLDGLIRATGSKQGGFCQGCFTGAYPVDVHLVEKEAFEACERSGSGAARRRTSEAARRTAPARVAHR